MPKPCTRGFRKRPAERRRPLSLVPGCSGAPGGGGDRYSPISRYSDLTLVRPGPGADGRGPLSKPAEARLCPLKRRLNEDPGLEREYRWCVLRSHCDCSARGIFNLCGCQNWHRGKNSSVVYFVGIGKRSRRVFQSVF